MFVAATPHSFVPEVLVHSLLALSGQGLLAVGLPHSELVLQVPVVLATVQRYWPQRAKDSYWSVGSAKGMALQELQGCVLFLPRKSDRSMTVGLRSEIVRRTLILRVVAQLLEVSFPGVEVGWP